MIEKYVERKSYKPAKKFSEDFSHHHYGIAYHMYGICPSFHYTRLHKTKVIWDPCLRCNFGGVTKYRLKKDGKEGKEGGKKKTRKKAVEKGNKDDVDEVKILRIEVSALRSEMEKYKKMYQEIERDVSYLRVKKVE